MIATKAPFKPTAVLITPEAEWQDGNQTRVDPARVTLLHLDSDENSGWLYTKDEWESDREPRVYRRYGEHEGLRENERVELLPDMWIVKIDEREHWLDPVVLDRTNRIFGVYVFDRRKHVHCCSFEATYEFTFLGSQWEHSREFTDDETEDLDERIREGDRDCETVSYWGVHDVDRMLAETCQEGCLPKGNAGGFKVEVKSVVADDAIAEIEEVYCQSEL